MSKHTPGPWHIGSNMILKVINGSYFSIAEVNDWEDETVPNARLIAAAPDLLEALELSLEEMKDDWITLDGEFGPFMQEFGDIESAIKEEHASTKTIRMAIAAIAKAKGEA